VVGGKSRECGDKLPSLGEVSHGALLGVWISSTMTKVDWVALDERPDPLGRVGLLERLVVE